MTSADSELIAQLRSELDGTRALLERQQQLLPRLAEAAGRAEDRESEAVELRQQL